MNTRKDATEKIKKFLSSDCNVLLLTGTFQHEKHPLVFKTLFENISKPCKILFRGNHASNLKVFLSPIFKLNTEPKTGTPINVLGGHKLWVDTINPKSWDATPTELDVVIVYPVDSLNEKNGPGCVQDLINRNSKKIILVSWTDNKDFNWIDQFSPVKAIFDAEEERPEYHQDMIKVINRIEN